MAKSRNEFRTGALVFLTLAILVGVLIYLGAPGVFVPQRTYRIYFDNAAGIRPGARVLVAGRRVGQVTQVFSPVDADSRPSPEYESLVEVRVDADTTVHRKVHVEMRQLTMLSDMVIDFTQGEAASGEAPEGTHFLGTRQAGVSEIVPLVLEKIDPAIRKTTEALDTLQKTAQNLDTLTADGADFPLAIAEFKKFGAQLNELVGAEGSLRKSVGNLETLTDPDGSLAKTLTHTERFTHNLASNQDIEVTLQNARVASQKLNRAIDDFNRQVVVIGHNLQQATDTIKRQPWRMVWPTTKDYEDEEARAPDSTWPRAVPVRRR